MKPTPRKLSVKKAEKGQPLAVSSPSSPSSSRPKKNHTQQNFITNAQMHKPSPTLKQGKRKQATDDEDSNDFPTPPPSSSPPRPRPARKSRNTTHYLQSDFVSGFTDPAHPVEEETNNDSDEAIRYVLKGFHKIMVRRNPRWKSLKPYEIAAEELGRRWLWMSHEVRSTWHLTPTVRRVAWPPHTRLPRHDVIDKRGLLAIEERFKMYPYAFDARGYLCTEYFERASRGQRTCANAVAAGSSSLPLHTRPLTTSMALMSTNDPDVCAARELVNAFETKLAKARVKLAEYTNDMSVGPVDAERVADDETSLETGYPPFGHQKHDIPDLRNVRCVSPAHTPIHLENASDKNEKERTTRETDARDEISEHINTTSIKASELVQKSTERSETHETEPCMAGPLSCCLEYNELVTRGQEESNTNAPGAYKASKKVRPLSKSRQSSITAGTQGRPIHEPSEIDGKLIQNGRHTEKCDEVSATESNTTSPEVEILCRSGTERRAIRSKLWSPDAVTEDDEANGATCSQDRLQSAGNESNKADNAEPKLSNAQHEKQNQPEKQIEPPKMTENGNTNTSTTFEDCDQRHHKQRRRGKCAVIPALDNLDGEDGCSQAQKLAQEERLEKRKFRKEQKRLAAEREVQEEKEVARMRRKIRKEQKRLAAERKIQEEKEAARLQNKKIRKEEKRLATEHQEQEEKEAARLENKRVRKEEKRLAAESREKEEQKAAEYVNKKNHRKGKRRLAADIQAQEVTRNRKGLEGKNPPSMEENAASDVKPLHKKRKRDTEVQGKPGTPCEEQLAQKKAKGKGIHAPEPFQVYDDGAIAVHIKEPAVNLPNYTRKPRFAQHTLYKKSRQATRVNATTNDNSNHRRVDHWSPRSRHQNVRSDVGWHERQGNRREQWTNAHHAHDSTLTDSEQLIARIVKSVVEELRAR